MINNTTVIEDRLGFVFLMYPCNNLTNLDLLYLSK